MAVLTSLLTGLAAWLVARIASAWRHRRFETGPGAAVAAPVRGGWWGYAAGAVALAVVCLVAPKALWIGAGIACAATAAAVHGLRRARALRERRIAEREAPDLLDMAACLAAAGLPAREALRISASGPGVLAAAVRSACQADDLGAPFLEALEEACDRLDIPEGRSMARALRSAETLGASLASALRDEAARSRERERLRVIQAADALPFKLALVTALFFLPALLIVVFVPSVLNFLERW